MKFPSHQLPNKMIYPSPLLTFGEKLIKMSRDSKSDKVVLVFPMEQSVLYDEESDHSNKAVRKTPEIESGHKVSEEVK